MSCGQEAQQSQKPEQQFLRSEKKTEWELAFRGLKKVLNCRDCGTSRCCPAGTVNIVACRVRKVLARLRRRREQRDDTRIAFEHWYRGDVPLWSTRLYEAALRTQTAAQSSTISDAQPLYNVILHKS